MNDELRKNVFVVGLDEFQRGELETTTNADSLAFHALLELDVVTRPGNRFADLLDQARTQLRDFDGSVDAIIAHWDFPTSVLAPILAREWDLPSPPLEAVVACEHKYWSRRVQAEAVPEVVPGFDIFDPFDDDAFASIDLEPPFWIKPIKSHSSQLGFKIETEEQFREAIPDIREGIRGFGEPFNEVLGMVDLPDFIHPESGNHCIAEKLMAGSQGTVEGTMFRGTFSVHGVIDSPKDEHGRHFSRYEYPAATLTGDVQYRMIDACERVLRQIGFDDGAWNIEFMYDEDNEQLWLVEVNTRISQSHSDLFAKVDGMSNHEVAIDIALGSEPRLPDRRGNFEVAAKCFLWTEEVEDGIVRNVPSAEDIAEVEERFPETHVEIDVQPGDRLSELADQSSYRYDVGTIFLGAQSREELVDDYEACRELLVVEVDPVDA